MPRAQILLPILLLLLAGCASAVANPFPQVRHDAAILQWGVVGVTDIQTLDPALASDPASLSVASLIYGGLVRFDSHLRVVPDGASRWTISHDGRIYTFTIRKGLRFADGHAVTAQDFAGALNRALGPDETAGAAPFYLSLIAHPTASGRNASPRSVHAITALNRSTLQITLQHPAAHFLAELAFPSSFVPDPQVTARFGPSWTDHAAGFGPFVVGEWRHTRYLRLDRNPYYYGGKPTFKGINLRFYPDSSPIPAYQKGSLDVISGYEPGQELPAQPFGARRVPGLALDYLAFNTTRLPFFRLNARRAFASIWSPAIARSVMARAVFPSHDFLPSAFGTPSALWHPSVSSATYLAGARYPGAKKFPPVSLVMTRDPHLYQLALRLRRAWKSRLGVSVTIRQLNTSNYDKVLSARAFDVGLVEWGGDYPDPQDFLGTQLGASSDNVTGWTRPTYDRTVALADSYSPLDPRREALFQQAAKLAARKVPILPLDEPAQSAIIRPDLQGVALTPLGTIVGDWAHARLRS
jgi:ABC-type oligopeptide transport system substrate-binding subunit